MSRRTPARAFLTGFLVLFLTLAGQGTASAAGLTVSGPASITRSATYTYYANLHAFYQSYTWYTRFCSTSTVGTCFTTWSWARSARVESGYDSYSRALAVDCSAGGNKSFQLRVTASGFNTPAETVYKVTKLCGEGGPL